ncbi:hypothetical protein DDT52_16295 [Brenneria roseae subsp. roseae]|uniref:hypothetical protein n=1 Tax=Brenneria roseae TaxID=1509241 RepID=UPI000D6173E4|nr:hypothetical protein [Brenneria roseae]PWC17103.1 hypothetical protein DDT52_16295 [Brenneria roseae subsp. roseae]
MKDNHGTLLPVRPKQRMVFEFSSKIIRNPNDDEIKASIKKRGFGYFPKTFLRLGGSYLIPLLRRLHGKQRGEASL